MCPAISRIEQNEFEVLTDSHLFSFPISFIIHFSFSLLDFASFCCLCRSVFLLARSFIFLFFLLALGNYYYWILLGRGFLDQFILVRSARFDIFNIIIGYYVQLSEHTPTHTNQNTHNETLYKQFS